MPQHLGLLEAIGSMADSFHHWLGLDRISWGWRMVIAFFVIDVIDIGLRAITLPLLFAFPLASHAAHIVFNTVMAFACAALWGAPGLIHLIDLGFGLIPGIFGDIILDILPLATIAGLIARWRGEVSTSSSSLATVRNGGTMLGFTIFIATISAMWWFGCFSLFSFGWWSIVVVSFLLIASVARSPLRVAGGAITAIVSVIAIFACLRFGYLSFVSSESYREETWTILEEDDDTRIKAARQADAARNLISEGVEAVTEAGRATRDAAEEAARDIGAEVGQKIGEVLLGAESDMPAWNDFSHWLGGKLAPEKKLEKEDREKKQFGPVIERSKQEQEAEVEVMETEERKGRKIAETKPLSDVVKRGPAETKLYESSYVLHQAEQLLETRKCRAKNFLFLSLGLFVFALITFGSRREVNSNTSSEPPLVDEDDDTTLSV